MIAALILAAGRGVRFGHDKQPKQFCEIADKPIFAFSVATYVGMPEVEQVVLAAHPDYVERTRGELERHVSLDAVRLVAGGATRQASIANAAASLAQYGQLERGDLIIVHNAASPNTQAAFVRHCIDAIEGYDAVQACVPDTRTVFERSAEQVVRVLPRAPLVYNCDPLIYRGDVLAALLEAQGKRGAAGETTSDTALELGYRIRLVESTYDNIKVTTPWDLAAVSSAMANP